MKTIRRSILALLLALVAGSAGATSIKGDVNADGTVSVTDVTFLVDIILGTSSDYDTYAADVNGDGVVSVADVTLLVNVILGGIVPATETGELTEDPAVGPALAPRRP